MKWLVDAEAAVFKSLVSLECLGVLFLQKVDVGRKYMC